MDAKQPSIRYSSDLPYPPVRVQARNPRYAAQMLDNIGGSNSEMSAASNYFYNHLICTANQEIATVFHKISIVEMHHLEIFGQLCLLLGEDPRLWTHSGRGMTYWTPAYNQYSGDLKQLIVGSLKSEQAAVDKYRRQAEIIKDPSICKNLLRIIQDEELHISIFRKLYRRYC